MCSKAPWPVAPAALQLGLLTPLVKPDGVEPHLSNGLAWLRQPHTDPAPHRPSPTPHQKKNSPKVFVNTKNSVVVAVIGKQFCRSIGLANVVVWSGVAVTCFGLCIAEQWNMQMLTPWGKAEACYFCEGSIQKGLDQMAKYWQRK